MQVGDWIVCVDASPAPNGAPVPLIKGECYLISAIWGDLPNGNGDCGLGDFWIDVGLDLHGVQRIVPDLCYGANRFRPLEPVRPVERELAAALDREGCPP